jgi:hypothetical protein
MRMPDPRRDAASIRHGLDGRPRHCARQQTMTDNGRRSMRAAKHQAMIREVNERITALNHAFAPIESMGQWICECANEDCYQQISLTPDEYEVVRSDPARFPVLPGHQLSDVEVVVEQHDRYLVVEKRGVARGFAVDRDPRGRSANAPRRT